LLAARITPEIRWDCPDELKLQAVESVKGRLQGQYPVMREEVLKK
jgi:hypothetical protein